MDPDLRATRISIIVHAVVAVIAGLISFQLPRALFGVAAGIVLLFITGFATERIVKKKGMKWWVGNGLIMYLFFWYITWVYLVNAG